MIPLRGKTALITGGSRGIGLAIAHALARHGASTVLVGRNPDTLRSALESVQAAAAAAAAEESPNKSPSSSSSSHTIAQGDVSLPATWQDLVERLTSGDGPTRSRGGVDILVNCAGVAQRGLLVRTSPADVDALLDANLKSAVLGCRYIGRLMMRSASALRRPSSSSAGVGGVGSGSGGRGQGTAAEAEAAGGMSIINVSSVMASKGGYGASVYAASKAGILGLTSSLALEFGQLGIRVNALVPGYIKTDMTENLNQDGLCRNIPLGRVGQAEEVAEAAVFLAQNSYANNCVLTIDGGLTAGFGPV